LAKTVGRKGVFYGTILFEGGAVLLSLLKEIKAKYCVIGGLAVNAYTDPVVSLDLDLAVIAGRLDDFKRAARANVRKISPIS